jgi:hypothetical protein
MLYLPEKVSLLARVKERGFSGAFLGLVLVTMAGWVYLLGLIFLKCVFGVFPEQEIFHDEMEVDDLSGGRVHKNFSR